jgi:hypothetical protein
MIFSGIQANREDPENRILFQYITTYNIIFCQNFACIFAFQDDNTRNKFVEIL